MKHLTPQQKKIVDIVVTCIEVILVIFSITLSAIIIANPNQISADVGKGKTKLLPVLTDSMAGDQKDSFKAGDLIIATEPKNRLKLEKGDIITFKGSVNGYDALITHRIVDIKVDADGNAQTYYTRGDANPTNAIEEVNANKVLAVYRYHLKGIGSAINWLQNSTHFLLVIVLPLALLFIYNIVMFVRMLMQWKLEKAGANAAPVDEEEIKRKAIEEYLASQKAEETPAATAAEETPAEPQNDGNEE